MHNDTKNNNSTYILRSGMHNVANNPFTTLANQPDEQIGLLRAALSIAADTYPGLDADKYMVQIKQWVKDISQQLPEDADIKTRLNVLNRFLFEQLGFSGNTTDYYDPRNSYINEVLDRRQGIPITLSVIYIELGKRLGLNMSGISFPGHFLVKLPCAEGEVVLDPFNGGISLSEQDLTDRLENLLDVEVDNLGPFLQPASNKDILIRMLSNLKTIYHHRGDAERTLELINKILLLDPQRSDEYRERGLLLTSLECFHSALSDLRRYHDSSPGSDASETVRDLIIRLQHKHHYLH
ncbi:MAG: tetratricopeptide repeat protein [Pseudomonadota bacterium]